MNNSDVLILEKIYAHEKNHADEIFMTQPVGNGQVVNYTWAQTLDQARRMAAHLQSRGLPRSAKIAILSKNCAHFFMAELAIWMAGYTTVAIFPTEQAYTVKFVLEHSEASLLFVGKLDEWHKQSHGVPAQLPCIAFPLSPETAFDKWNDIVANNVGITGQPDPRCKRPGHDHLHLWLHRPTQRRHALFWPHHGCGQRHHWSNEPQLGQ